MIYVIGKQDIYSVERAIYYNTHAAATRRDLLCTYVLYMRITYDYNVT